MTIDYKITDLKNSFSVSEASFAWCDADRAIPNNINNLYMMEAALIEAIKEEEIKAEVPSKIVERRIRGGRYDMEEPDYERAIIPRKELIRLAEARGQKPKFLFPEMRSMPKAEVPAPLAKNNTIAQAKAKRENELHTLLKKVYLALRSELRRSPDADEMLAALRNHRKEFDTNEIIREIKDKRIAWVHTDGTEGISMGRKSLQNYLSKLNKKYKNNRL